ncbi:hypothetical protein RUM43_009192 [Polyplax serrata]|uniref:Uncharacterized protein n=1 Tax=Polyplax serrata TaxID=468196 RepID=A0AAN8NUY9_POLSC
MDVNELKTQVTEIETINPQYEQLLADVWVGIVLTLLLLSCVCLLRNTEETDLGTRNSINIDCESLPSYTIASGLPTYEEAIQMDKKVEKPDSLMKQDSSISLQMGMIQSVSKSSLLNYLNTFVQEKT